MRAGLEIVYMAAVCGCEICEECEEYVWNALTHCPASQPAHGYVCGHEWQACVHMQLQHMHVCADTLPHIHFVSIDCFVFSIDRVELTEGARVDVK